MSFPLCTLRLIASRTGMHTTPKEGIGGYRREKVKKRTYIVRARVNIVRVKILLVV